MTAAEPVVTDDHRLPPPPPKGPRKGLPTRTQHQAQDRSTKPQRRLPPHPRGQRTTHTIGPQQQIALQEWVEAVNTHGGLGKWHHAQSTNPKDVPYIIEKIMKAW